MPGRSIPGSRTIVAYGWPGGRVRIVDGIDVGRFIVGFVPIKDREGWYTFFSESSPPAGPFGTRKAAIDHARRYE